MQSTSPGGGSGQPSGKSANGSTNANTAAHKMFVTLAGEAIGVFVIAIFADLNDDLGRFLVIVMIGWFLVFLMTNAPALSALIKKA